MAVPPDLPTLDETVALVRRWLAAAEDVEPDPGARMLAGLLKDPRGPEFTLGFVDRVVRPEDPRVAAKNFERLSRHVPRFLPWHLRALITLGGGFSLLLPQLVIPIARRVLRRMVDHLVIPIARRVLRRMVDHLVVDATPAKLEASLGRLRASGARLNLNLLGEAVLGHAEAARRLQGTRELLARDDVDYVSVKVSSIAAQLSLWGFDESVERVTALLRPLYLDAARSRRPKFINLDM